MSEWRINTYSQTTNFTFSINKFDVSFNSSSNNIDSLFWEFGDGNTSKTSSINHTYKKNGTYKAVLTSYKNGCTDTLSKWIAINVKDTVIEEPKDTSTANDHPSNTTTIFFYPNPFNNVITIKNCRRQLISIYDLSGKKLNCTMTSFSNKQGVEINTSQLLKGSLAPNKFGVIF